MSLSSGTTSSRACTVAFSVLFTLGRGWHPGRKKWGRDEEQGGRVQKEGKEGDHGHPALCPGPCPHTWARAILYLLCLDGLAVRRLVFWALGRISCSSISAESQQPAGCSIEQGGQLGSHLRHQGGLCSRLQRFLGLIFTALGATAEGHQP